LPQNHDVDPEPTEPDLDGLSERRMETQAKYRANGVSMETYWNDREAGYCE